MALGEKTSNLRNKWVQPLESEKRKSKNFTVMGLLKIYKIGKRLKAMKAYLFDFMQLEKQTYQ